MKTARGIYLNIFVFSLLEHILLCGYLYLHCTYYSSVMRLLRFRNSKNLPFTLSDYEVFLYLCPYKEEYAEVFD